MTLAEQVSSGRERAGRALGRAYETIRHARAPSGPDRAPTLRVPLGKGRYMRVSTDRVRARPAVTPTLSGALGLGAIGLGVLGTFFPRRVAGFLGIPANRASVVALFGLRELATGYSLVSDPTMAPTLWARVAGDVFDAAVLRAADNPSNPKRDNARAALAFVLVVGALDLIAAGRMSTVDRNCARGGRR
ncbi:MAG TPA: hypothetical protein VD929_01340 [Caulobacteraceae bacterium]|nr:hypothetical protein [Caulobacteraceae bacterium]